MSLTAEQRTIVVDLEFERAVSIWHQLPKLIEFQYLDNAMNRIYYALFHAVSAMLISDGYPVSSHKGAVVGFGQHYVVTEKFSGEEGNFYASLQGMREKADYNCSYKVTKDDVMAYYEPAHQLLLHIADYLGKDNLFDTPIADEVEE